MLQPSPLFNLKCKNSIKICFARRKWVLVNLNIAQERNEALRSVRDEVEKLEKSIVKNIKLKAIRYDCGWNVEHIRGCLKSLDRIAKMHESDMKVLEGSLTVDCLTNSELWLIDFGFSFILGRTIAFAQSSGVSLEGHVMLFTGDVQHNWLDVCDPSPNHTLPININLWTSSVSSFVSSIQFIRNISKQDAYLKRIPAYEKALSQVLRQIRISRRKFMPKAQVVHYAGHLCKVTTSMLDYLTAHSYYPKSWPENLENFGIVIES